LSSFRLGKTLLQLKRVGFRVLGASRDFCAGISLLEGWGRLAAGQAARGQGCPKPHSGLGLCRWLRSGGVTHLCAFLHWC